MENKHYALIPAAGSGSRMGGGLPKQYLSLAGRPMIYHAIHTFFTHARIARVYVVLAPGDSHWDRFDWSEFERKLVGASLWRGNPRPEREPGACSIWPKR